MTGDIITVNARKYDGKIRRSWVGELVSRTGTRTTILAKFAETVEHNDLGTIAAGTFSTEHFWTDRWYNVFQFREPNGRPKAIYCNITMPATMGAGVIDYIDLDLDVIVWPDGRVEVLDRDDFERNSVKYGYPADVKAGGEAALGKVLELIERREFPFASY